MTLTQEDVLAAMQRLGGRRLPAPVIMDAVQQHRYPGSSWLARFQRFWLPQYGSLYARLLELEDRGLVTSEWEGPDGPHPRRRLYSLAQS